MNSGAISVLLVDDNESDAILTRRRLQNGTSPVFAVDCSSSYRDALEKLKARPYDVALIDFYLDQHNGVHLMRAAFEAGVKTPMIILTGEGDGDVEQDAIHAGAADYVVKGQFDTALITRVIRHAIDRQRSQAALEEERQRLKTLINTLPDVIYFKDSLSRFILCNASQLSLLGVERPEQALGRTDADFFPAAMAVQYRRDEERIVDTGQPMINKEEVTREPTGRERWILTSKIPIHGPAGTVTGIVGLGRDITELKQAQTDLRRARDELEVRVQDRTVELSQAVTALREEVALRKAAEEQLREAEEQYRTIFEEALDAIIVVDVDTGAFLDFNDQACAELGYDRAEFALLTMSQIDAGGTTDGFTRHVPRIMTIGSEVFETRHRCKSGAVRNLIASCRPITLHDRNVVLAIFHDITERKRIEDQLQNAVIRLEAHNKAKTEFVANVSHELKTPLTSMMYGTRNLLKGIAGPLPDKALHYLKMFDAECNRLMGTINDILNLSKLDNQGLTLSSVVVPLGGLLDRGLEPMRIQVDAAGLELELTGGDTPLFVKCDPGMLQRVFQNLLSNAIKFTPPPGRIRVHSGPAGDNPGMAVISVTDTGIGIPPEAMTHIAERYFRVGAQATGSGIGLAISKEIVALHGGTFSVTSPPAGQERGTCIAVTVTTAPPPNVLVVDDDPVMLVLLARQLSSRGYKVETASRGDAALKRMESGTPDIVILDMILEDTTGGELILALKAVPTFRYVPILAVTGATISEVTADVLRRFAVPTLPKPWAQDALFAMLESAMLSRTAFQAPG